MDQLKQLVIQNEIHVDMKRGILLKLSFECNFFFKDEMCALILFQSTFQGIQPDESKVLSKALALRVMYF